MSELETGKILINEVEGFKKLNKEFFYDIHCLKKAETLNHEELLNYITSFLPPEYQNDEMPHIIEREVWLLYKWLMTPNKGIITFDDKIKENIKEKMQDYFDHGINDIKKFNDSYINHITKEMLLNHNIVFIESSLVPHRIYDNKGEFKNDISENITPLGFFINISDESEFSHEESDKKVPVINFASVYQIPKKTGSISDIYIDNCSFSIYNPDDLLDSILLWIENNFEDDSISFTKKKKEMKNLLNEIVFGLLYLNEILNLDNDIEYQNEISVEKITEEEIKKFSEYHLHLNQLGLGTLKRKN